MSNEQDMNFEATINKEIQVAEELISKQALYMRFFQMNGKNYDLQEGSKFGSR